MSLTYVRTYKHQPDSNKIKDLYISAFPAYERPDFDLNISWPGSQFYAVYQNDQYVGFFEIIDYLDLSYVFFFAISDAKRGQGIGTEVLRHIIDTFGKRRLFLLVEDLDPNCDSLPLRLRRVGFYERNGFHKGPVVRELGENYQMMIYDGHDVSPKEFMDLMIDLMGDEMGKEYYPFYYENGKKMP